MEPAGEKINLEFQNHRKELEACAWIFKRIIHLLEEFTFLGTSLCLVLSRVSTCSTSTMDPKYQTSESLIVKHLSVFIYHHVGSYKGGR